MVVPSVVALSDPHLNNIRLVNNDKFLRRPVHRPCSVEAAHVVDEEKPDYLVGAFGAKLSLQRFFKGH